MGQRSDNSAVYIAVYADIRKHIFSGDLSPGDLLPSESQLCAKFGASRETVRKGLKELESEGLIYSRPKIGYFVSAPNHSNLILQSNETSENCTTHYSDIHGILPDERIQKLLDIPANRKVIELSQVTRNAEGIPVAYNVKYVPYERAYPSVESEIRFAVLPDLTFSKISAFEYYTDVIVSAVNANDKIAEILECEKGSALLLIERIFIRQDGNRIGYSMHYNKSPFGNLRGTSGYKV